MAKEEITIELTIEYDPEKNNGKPRHIFLYQFITSLNREWPVLEVGYKGIKKHFRLPGTDINKIALRKVDNVSDEALPKDPSWLKDKTVLPKRVKS